MLLKMQLTDVRFFFFFFFFFWGGVGFVFVLCARHSTQNGKFRGVAKTFPTYSSVMLEKSDDFMKNGICSPFLKYEFIELDFQKDLD